MEKVLEEIEFLIGETESTFLQLKKTMVAIKKKEKVILILLVFIYEKTI